MGADYADDKNAEADTRDELAVAKAEAASWATRCMRIEAAADQLRRAVTDEGPQPHFHRATRRRHRLEWPTLHVAIDTLLGALAAPAPREGDPPTAEVATCHGKEGQRVPGTTPWVIECTTCGWRAPHPVDVHHLPPHPRLAPTP